MGYLPMPRRCLDLPGLIVDFILRGVGMLRE
jgi:hypothetical protein